MRGLARLAIIYGDAITEIHRLVTFGSLASREPPTAIASSGGPNPAISIW